LDAFSDFILKAEAFMWKPWMLALLAGTGILLSVRTRFVQFRKLGYSVKLLFLGAAHKDKSEQEQGDVTPFQALTTALAGTVGNGNIAGVATAIATGGPGAAFWMTLMAFLGMATKYSEALLGVKFRRIADDGTISGGPMHYIERGLGLKWLAVVFSIFGLIAGIAVGNMAQANSVAKVFESEFFIPTWGTGVFLMLITWLVIVGGIRRIAHVAEALVPTMVLIYLFSGIAILILRCAEIPDMIALILRSAFHWTAPLGGFAGATVREAMRLGVSRGLLSNEAGLGSAPIVHGAAKTKSPARQGCVAIMEVFIDTVVVCNTTAVIILLSGKWTDRFADGAQLSGTPLTAAAFNSVLRIGGYPLGGLIVAACSILFGYTTLIGWSYYNEQFVRYFFGHKAVPFYRWIFCLICVLGAVATIEFVWSFGTLCVAFMAVPNLITLILLSGIVEKETLAYREE
jgi:AGCS family alanine or glycine:cation symporter